MNIRQAKEEIKHTVKAYLAKDAEGGYLMPTVRQRPILLMGPPGIGKTQIMEQAARECGIGLVSYTITHHTRQSAVGLPVIREKEFLGSRYSVTEYTMSEIIASVYEKMEETGLREGILFLDEVNCVSETLAPAMLQFLQCKTFGNQAVPGGWLIVAAGNPPEYNRSVREFDTVTLDRVRCIEVEPDYRVWREYARNREAHGALLSYLELRPKNFYRIEADVDGMQYVTARGWEDFSYLLKRYEEQGLPVSAEIAYEYLHQKEVAEDVAAYLDLYRKYQDDYGISGILSGRVKPAVYARVYAAGFDERLSVVHLLLDGLMQYFSAASFERGVTDSYFAFLKGYQTGLAQTEDPAEEYVRRRGALLRELEEKERGGLLEKEDVRLRRRVLSLLKDGKPNAENKEEAFLQARECFARQRERLEASEAAAGEALSFAFDFMEEASMQGEEMVVFVTELAVSRDAAAFLAEHPCARYQAYSSELLIGTRKGELLSEIRKEETRCGGI